MLLFTGCTTAQTSSARATPTARLSPTPAMAAIPSPVLTPLAAPPQNCAITPPPQRQTLAHLGLNTNIEMVGGGPFWIVGVFYSSTLHLGQSEWPITKIVVDVGPNYAQPVTLRLRDLQTGDLAWWTDAETPPGAATQTLVLDPPTNTESVGHVAGLPDVPHGEVEPGWKEWGVFPLFRSAGCYALEVSWAGGSWRSVISVGD
jgi:hypothetical protein